MTRAILCMTGSELTRGETRDANGPFLAGELSEVGVRVDEVILVPDDPDLLAAAIRGAVSRAPLVIVSGGLGPTADDHTVAVLGRVFERPVLRHPEVRARMLARAASRGLTEDRLPPNYWKQAEVIEGAQVLLNPVGLAPGMIIRSATGMLAVLPGVPRELQAIFRESVLPAIREAFSIHAPRIVRAKVMGHGESWAEAKIQKLGIDFARLEYGISARPGELLVKFISHRSEHHAYLDEVRDLLAGTFGDDLILLPEGLLGPGGVPVEVDHARIVHDLLIAAGATVSSAESCTSGLIAKRLTDHAGSSAYFLGSIVAYSNGAKERLLGVPREVIETHGAVSAETCEAMARGAIERFGSDLAVAVTGIAGPGGGTGEKPVGLVWIGIARAGSGASVERSLFWGDRDNVRTLAAVRALDLLRRAL